MEKKDIKDIENIENISLDPVIVRAIESLQTPEVNEFYDDLLKLCQRKAIEDPDLFEDDGEALDIIRGFHQLRSDLRLILPLTDHRALTAVEIPGSDCSTQADCSTQEEEE